MSRPASQLRFSPYYGAGKGFAAANIDRERVTDETVIRELVQNALDASKGDEVEVTIRCENVKLRSIPHINDYRKAFAKAKKSRAGKGGPPEKNAIERIEKGLKASEVKVLTCIDNGKGIDNVALRALYGEADTTKVDTGRGSVGVGHLTAFAASDLRYVLYAGRHSPDMFGEFTFGGHVVLAVHREGSQQYDASGFIVSDNPDESLFISDAHGVPQVPRQVKKWLPKSGTGSAVVICGYSALNGSSRGDETACEGAALAIAKNFLVAIHLQELSVLCEWDSANVRLGSAEELRRVLLLGQSQQRRRRGQGVLGRTAYGAWRTVTEGRDVDLPERFAGVRVWFRNLPPTERTRVSVFRDGMWITDDVVNLRRRDFGDCQPFDAVVNIRSLVEGEHRLSLLVREAEGASHLEINPNVIEDSANRKELKEMLKDLRRILVSEAGPRENQDIIPEDLRMFVGDMAAPVARPRPPAADLGELEVVGDDQDPEDQERGSSQEGEGEGGGIDEGGGGGGGDEGGGREGGGDDGPGSGPGSKPTSARRRKSPRQGSQRGIRITCRVINNDRVMVSWKAESLPTGAVGFSVMSPSGSDSTCEQPVKPRYWRIARATLGEAKISLSPEDPDPYEARFDNPPLTGTAEIILAETPHPTETAFLKATLAHRQPSQPSEPTTNNPTRAEA